MYNNQFFKNILNLILLFGNRRMKNSSFSRRIVFQQSLSIRGRFDDEVWKFKQFGFP